MRPVLQRIAERCATYSESPFFEFLRDPTIDPRRKLAFAPEVAHYVLTFADLSNLLLPQEQPADGWQEIVNANAAEDSDHWKWFLVDLASLGRDPQLRFSDAVKRIWSDDTVRTRRLGYQLCHYALAADSVGRLVLVQCFESAFKVTVVAVRQAANEFTAVTGRPLYYLGGAHADAEDSHTMDTTESQRRLESIALAAEARGRLLEMVDQSFDLFTAFAAEMLDLAQRALVVPSPTSMSSAGGQPTIGPTDH